MKNRKPSPPPVPKPKKVNVRSVVVPAGGTMNVEGEVEIIGVIKAEIMLPTPAHGWRRWFSGVRRFPAFEVVFCSRVIEEDPSNG